MTHPTEQVRAQVAAWLGVDDSDPVERLAMDLVRADREFLNRLVEHRRNHLTQTEVAVRMGVSQSAVSQLESADRDPQLSTLRRYALALGLMVEHRVIEVDKAEGIRDGVLASLEARRAQRAASPRPRPRPRPAIEMDDRGPKIDIASYA